MARPKPQVLLSKHTDANIHLQILAADSIYVVLYREKPINIKSSYWSLQGHLNKYGKTAYPNSAPAQNLADKLNHEFNTTDFTVKKII
jgi:hypothetical protein